MCVFSSVHRYIYLSIKMHFEAVGDLCEVRAPSSGICHGSGGCRASRKAAKDRKSCMNFPPPGCQSLSFFLFFLYFPLSLIRSSKWQVLGIPRHRQEDACSLSTPVCCRTAEDHSASFVLFLFDVETAGWGEWEPLTIGCAGTAGWVLPVLVHPRLPSQWSRGHIPSQGAF